VRIVLVNASCQRVGGVETYLDTIMPALQNAGHEIAFCYEAEVRSDRATIGLPPGAPSWCLERMGMQPTLAAVRQWSPDLIYSHHVESVELQEKLLDIAPTVFFAHAYYGTCISGSKAFRQPRPTPCHRQFGWQCLFHFFPRRCGGMNPLTMASLYRVQATRLELLKRHQALITHSEYMRDEYIRHGLPPERVFSVGYSVHPLRAPGTPTPPRVRTPESRAVWRLAFAGRMDNLKGGLLLLKALPLVRAAGRPLHLTLAGDGPQRSQWERAAAEVTSSHPDIQIEFPGWLGEAELATLFQTSDLLTVPSIWPEPFGVVGVQAGFEGVPAAAFAVGGIPTWLIDGVSGHLAPGDPPTAEGLARVILQCLSNEEHYLDLCKGAEMMAERFTIQAHLSELVPLLESAANSGTLNAFR
jgi:glycosyltransferase involved in cell wall biosynthesis